MGMYMYMLCAYIYMLLVMNVFSSLFLSLLDQIFIFLLDAFLLFSSASDPAPDEVLEVLERLCVLCI